MKIVLAALNAKYVHSNLAVYDLEAYARQQWNREMGARSEEEAKAGKDEKAGKEEQSGRLACTSLELVIREYTINHNLNEILQSLYQEKAAVVAFSCYIWNVHEILTIAKELYKVAPQTRIWLGGPEVSFDSERRLEENSFVEGIMQGEGEGTFYELVKMWTRAEETDNLSGGTRENDLESLRVKDVSKCDDSGKVITGRKNNCNMYHDVKGIIYRGEDNQLHQNPARPLMSLDDLPFIYEDLSLFENKILYYETSRGCPYSCSYCLSSIDRQVRFRSFHKVQRELQFFLDQKVSQVKFIDRTFNCKREHALAIWKYLLEHDNGVTNFHFEVAADLIGEEELQVFRQMRPGLIQLEIGLQSTNPATIQEIRRVMDIDKLKDVMLTIHSFGNIHQHLDLIAGLPFEDFVTFKQSFNDAYEMKPNQLQLGFLKVLKGSYMGEQISDYELKYQDTQPYEVLSTRWLTYDEVLALKQVEEMVEVYYNSDQFEHVLPYVVQFFPSPYAFYEALGKYYKENHLLGIGFKRESRYEALREFCLEWFDKGDDMRGNLDFSFELLDSLLTFDYYLRENAKSRPSWAKQEPIEKSLYHNFFRNGGTEEVDLQKEGYDSKAAARMMHIEPIVPEAVRWIEGGFNTELEQCQQLYCLFDYEHRNPLSKDAEVRVLSHL